MIKFDENKPNIEVKGVSTVSWVNLEHLCYSKETFKKTLEENKSVYAFMCGSKDLRNNEEMCLVAATNGIDIDTLYTFGILNDKIILQALKTSINGNSIKPFKEQVERLMEIVNVEPELFVNIIDMCPKGINISSAVFNPIRKNEIFKEVIKNDKECLLYCMSKDPNFYKYASLKLKNDPKIALIAAKSGIALENIPEVDEKIIQIVNEELLKFKQEQKEIYYGLDGTQFDTMEQAIAYNQSLSSVKKM